MPSSPLPAQVSPLSAQTVSGLSSESLGLKLLGSILENKCVVSAGDKESLQPTVCGNELIGCRVLTCPAGVAGPGGPSLTGVKDLTSSLTRHCWWHRVTVEPVSSEGPSP